MPSQLCNPEVYQLAAVCTQSTGVVKFLLYGD